MRTYDKKDENRKTLLDRMRYERTLKILEHLHPLVYPKPIIGGKKQGRNEPCDCGSGKKFKKCCINK